MKSAQDAQTRSADPFVWTTEQVIGLAPDKQHIRMSRGFAVPEKWTHLGRMGDTLWGIFSIKGKNDLLVTVSLTQLILTCSCKSRKYPCNHLLSLLFLYAESSASFTDAQIPAPYADQIAGKQIVTNRADNQSANAERTLLNETKKRKTDIARREQRRRQNITAGLLELELWLHDMIERGLAAVQDEPKTYWTAMADRLVDYQVGEIAYQIRRMSLLPGKKVDWHETLLRDVGWLYLLIQGFKKYDDLPLDMQMNLRMAVGWLPRFEEAIACDQDADWQKIADSWVVIGKQVELRGKQTLQRTWLWGEKTNRPALLLDVMTASKHQSTPIHIVGSTIDATLYFAPTTTPLYAQLADIQIGEIQKGETQKGEIQKGETQEPSSIIRSVAMQRRQAERFVEGYESIGTAITHYRQTITTNPWLRYFPIALNRITIDAVKNSTTKSSATKSSAIKSSAKLDPIAGPWGVRDTLSAATIDNSAEKSSAEKSNAQNRTNRHEQVAHLLPLPTQFSHRWYLQALSHQEPLSIFGEWNGEEFTPLSVWHEGRLLEIRVLGGTT